MCVYPASRMLMFTNDDLLLIVQYSAMLKAHRTFSRDQFSIETTDFK